MNNDNYSRTIHVNNNPSAVYEALTVGIEYWWTKPDVPIVKIGDRAKFTFPPGHSFWTFEATALKENKYVEMKCVAALHLHEGQPKEIEQEWLDTTVVWQIFPKSEGADIRIEHIGLTPSLHCYNICQTGWDMFFVDSLKAYLDTGIGKPHNSHTR